MKKVVLPLLANGLSTKAVFVQLRGMYASDVGDREIRDLISWAAAKNPQPSGYHWRTQTSGMRSLQREIMAERVTTDQAIANTEKWLRGFRCDEGDLWHISPWRPLEDPRFDSLMLFAALYSKEDRINIVTEFALEQKDGGQKANPSGSGKILRRDDWMRWSRDYGTPQSKAGAWIRPNPVKKRGSGRDGAVTDEDVTSHRFCLLESDALPIDLQVSVWARLPLPVAAIIASGGRSVHAWIMLSCPNAQEYRSKVNRIHALLARLGICQSNKNPSRLSRLPGAQREIGKHRDGIQRLLYLNPEPLEAPILGKR